LDESDLMQRLAKNSFGQLFNFIMSLQVVFKQLGNLLAEHNQLLTKLAHVLVITVSLGKQFVGHLKAEQDDPVEKDITLNGYVKRQSKSVVRKGLQIIKQLYLKFSSNRDLVDHLSTVFYRCLLADQLPTLNERYISERSMLLEIVCLNWSHPNCLHNFETFPTVLPAFLRMLSAPRIDSSVF